MALHRTIGDGGMIFFEFMERNTIAREVQTVGIGKNVIYLAYAW